jgi:branched-chain amino acid transport system permease protein
MDQLIFFINKVLISGTALGSIYALGAIGVTLIFGILRFAHFAHGDMMTLGAFVAFLLALAFYHYGITFPIPTGFVVLPIAMAITAAVALGIDKTIYAPLRRRGAKPVTLLIASIGATLMMQGLIRLFFGAGQYSFFDYGENKSIIKLDMSWLGGSRPITFTEPQLIMIVVTAILIVALNYFLTRTRLGKAMRAMADNADLAQVSGINTQLVVRVTWVIAGALACAAGTMLSLDVSLKPDLAFNIVLPIFAAAIVGGLGQAYGAIAGGFLLGFAETLAVFNWATLLRPLQGVLPNWIVIPPDLSLVPTEYKLTVAFIILIMTLLWRPTGIFKGAST